MLTELLATDPRTSPDILLALAQDPNLAPLARAAVLGHYAGPALDAHATLRVASSLGLHRALRGARDPEWRSAVLAAQHPMTVWLNIRLHDDLTAEEIAAAPRSRKRSHLQHEALVANRRTPRAQVLRSIKAVAKLERFTPMREALILGAADRHGLTSEQLPHAHNPVDGARSPGVEPYMLRGPRVERPAPHLEQLMGRLTRDTYGTGDAAWDAAVSGAEDGEVASWALVMCATLTNTNRANAVVRSVASSSRLPERVRQEAASRCEPEPADVARRALEEHPGWPLTATQATAALTLDSTFTGSIPELVTAACAITA